MENNGLAIMFHLRNIHIVVGIAGLIAFALTGQYMHWVHDHLYGMPEGPRLFFRSVHIYLLWSALLNIILGAYFKRLEAGIRSHIQLVTSLFILAGPFMLCASFFFEKYNEALLRPVAKWAIIMSAAGVVVQACLMGYDSRRS